MNPIKVVPFLNPFVDPRRIEILVDWQNDWSATLLNGVTEFELLIADKPDGKGTPLATLKTPMIIPEVAEQLFPLFPAVSELAPKFVEEMLRLVSRPDNDSTILDLKPPAALFMSPHPTADLERWYRGDSARKIGKGFKPGPRTDVQQAVDAVLGARKREAFDGGDDIDIPLEVRNPALLLKAVEAAQAARPQDVSTLLKAMEKAAVEDQLTYAEALRREAIYRRRRAMPEDERQQPMISASANEASVTVQRGDLRRIARDEPVIGTMFRALHWFAWPSDLDADLREGAFLFARPVSASDRFMPGATRIGRDSASRWVSVLRRDGDDRSYFAQSMHVRQVSEALLVGEEPDDEEMQSSQEQPPIQQILQTKQILPPFEHPPSHENVPDPSVTEAFIRNNNAFAPEGGDAEDVHKDRERELNDAAESMRRHHPPFDAIGITWERNAVERALDPELPKFHVGYKGYRIDVRENGGAWESLCTVERAALGPQGEEIFRGRLPRDSYVFQSVQDHSPKEATARIYTMPADFVQWAGGSAVVSAPLDRLGQALPRTKTGEHPLIALREAGRTRTYPRYGRTYDFRARGVGLTGVGPLVTEDTSTDAGVDSVEFLRGIPMAAPETEVAYRDLVPLGSNGEEIALPAADDEKARPDLPMKVTGLEPHLDVRALLPITHWRVALHARGLTDEERESRGGVAFENACARFVARSRDRWRKRSPEEQRNGSHLSAVDPDCAGIQLVSKAWFPFSTNRNADRYLITGVTPVRHREIGEATFSELVVKGEKIVEELDLRPDELRVPVVSELLPAADTKDERARLLTGFHSLVELSGIWSERAKRHPNTKRRRWTRQLSMRSGPQRPIGGRITPLDGTLLAGLNQPLIRTAWFHAEASYASMSDPAMERNLPEPDQKAVGAPATETCDIEKPTHVRAEVIRWRKSMFEKACTGEPSQTCFDAIEKYKAFVMAQLACVEAPDAKAKHEPAFCFLPQIATSKTDDPARTLVRPLFTFPGTPVYGEIATLPSGVRSMPVKIGEYPSFGIGSITVENGGSGYTQPPKVTITDASGSGAEAVAEIKDGKVDHIIVKVPGAKYSKDVQVEISGGGTGAVAVAQRSTSRRLPWIDDEITWVVRLAWRIPLEGGPVERPLELSAVREFQLFRRDKKKPDDPRDTKPRAVLPRPGVDVLHDIDLDRVEFTWVDAVTDRDAHDFEYEVVAIPEDEITFAKQSWMTVNVIVPDSKIAERPESLRFLPMRSETGVRRLGLYVSDPKIRQRTDHVTYFAALAADDPVLPIQPPPKAKAAGAPDLIAPPTLDQLFPSTRIAVMPVRNWNELRAQRPTEDGVEASAIGTCKQTTDEVPRAPLFVIANRGADGKPLITATGVFGNPFFRVRVHAFDDDRFPALAHTAASDPAESDWLQFYPDALAWKNGKTLAVLDAWGNPMDTSDKNLIWYRWHFFVPATDKMSFHLSTFYTRAPELDPATQTAALRDAWTRFTSTAIPATADVFVHAEEGIRAPTYRLDANDLPVEEELAKHEQVFMVMRSTQEAQAVRIHL